MKTALLIITVLAALLSTTAAAKAQDHAQKKKRKLVRDKNGKNLTYLRQRANKKIFGRVEKKDARSQENKDLGRAVEAVPYKVNG